MTDSITFDAIVSKVSTLADGGLRVTLDLPEDAINAASWLMECKRNETALHVACVKDDREQKAERRKAVK